MKKINTTEMIDGLTANVRQILVEAEKLRNVDNAMLAVQPAPGKWNVAQVLEHLNFYSRFYLAAIEEKLHQHSTVSRDTFTPGWFGNYFTNMMKPSSDTTVKNKMKALKSATPPPTINASEALEQFIRDQHQLLTLLQLSRSADLGKLRVPTSITNLITLKLGDTFRFFIAHEQRHFVQIRNTLAEVRANVAGSRLT